MDEIEDLLETFKQHSRIARRHQDKLLRDFKKNYPAESTPDHFKKPFDLPAALATMCKEILRLKNG